MKQYLVVCSGSNSAKYSLSTSRNAMRHLVEKNAKTVWVYDKNGWWISFADTDKSGNPFRPKMYHDGEPKQFYKEKFAELSASK